MTQRDLSEEWAWSQLEAWADGSLTGESRARMAAALAANPRLKAAADRAVAVRAALRASSALQPAMSARLRLQLLAIPGRSAWPTFALPAVAAAAGAVVALALWQRPEAPPPQQDPRVAAVAQDLETAMRYLQKSARITENEVTNAVGSGFRDAVAATRAVVGQQTDETGG